MLSALNMALGQRRVKGVVHHSDHGTQYTSIAFGLRCKEAKVRPSMGTVGDAYDNAMCESFFATLEHELLARRRFPTKAEARMAIFEFIEGQYNPICQASARLPTGPRARLREKRPHAGLWITACDPSAKPATETGQLHKELDCPLCRFYNSRCPHSSIGEHTPDEAYFGLQPMKTAA